jgi:hypothetical protein
MKRKTVIVERDFFDSLFLSLQGRERFMVDMEPGGCGGGLLLIAADGELEIVFKPNDHI